jgi:glutamate racemase
VDERPIGLFDSGVGGLSILAQVRRALPDEDLIYVADQANVPYGSRSPNEIRKLSEGITALLVDLDVKTVVVACNTASAAALEHLRSSFPDLPIIGMDLAVQQAASTTHTGVVGLLATPITIQGAFFNDMVADFGDGIDVIAQTPHGLVELIERGELTGPAVRERLEAALAPILAQDADTVVLACTHYPFVTPTLKKILGNDVNLIDPAPAIAEQTQRLVHEAGLSALEGRLAQVTYISSGDPLQLQQAALRLIQVPGEARRARWRQGRLGLE